MWAMPDTATSDLAHLDRRLGKILDGLRDAGRLDNACIVFLSDHGDMFYDHGLLGKEEKHYDACIHIPLIISGPGMREGATVDSFVQLEDVCPTILDLASQQFPHTEVSLCLPSRRLGRAVV